MNTRWRAVALTVILAILLSACGQARESGSAQSLVIRPRLVAATGEIVARSPANAEFCGGSFAASYTGQPLRCADGIKVEGVSLASLSDKTTTRGVTTGSAYLLGTIRNGVLRISRQGPPRQANPGPLLLDTPCPAPATGWAGHGEISMAAVSSYERRFPRDLTSAAVFHPRPLTPVLTVASTDPRRTIARLAAYRNRLCVVRSRFTLSRVQAASRTARALFSARDHGRPPYWVTGVGLSARPDGQPVVVVSVVMATAQLDQLLTAEPIGLVRIEPWLSTVHN
jgi:hypothetical protein